jgi:hypothetical protein
MNHHRKQYGQTVNNSGTVHFVLDEAVTLARMSSIEDALGIGRAYGIKLQLYYQSIGQLKKCFAEGQDVTVLSNTTQIFFGVSDQQTADYVSERLGESTIIVDSGSNTSGSNSSWNDGQQPTRGGGASASRSDSSQLQARRLLKPEEVANLPVELAITFTPGIPPLMTRLIRYYNEPGLMRLQRDNHTTIPQRACVMPALQTLRSIVTLIGFVVLALILTMLAQGTSINQIEKALLDEDFCNGGTRCRKSLNDCLQNSGPKRRGSSSKAATNWRRRCSPAKHLCFMAKANDQQKLLR